MIIKHQQAVMKKRVKQFFCLRVFRNYQRMYFRKKNNHDYFVQIRILLKLNVSLDFTSELRARQNCPDLLSRPHLLLRNLRLGVWTWTSDLNH